MRRLRRCANPVCDIAFYDGTRSRTQRWHSYARGGNRCNVAAYRFSALSR
ncbi:CGNR zinc finger domain-containing protein [Pseudonocardia sp.]